MSALDDFRAQNPAYKDVPDDKLADGVYNKFYASKMSRDDFNSKIGGASAAPASPQVQPNTSMDTAKQYAGSALRGVVGAATGIADLPIAAYKGTQELLSKATGKPTTAVPKSYSPISDAAESAMTKIGVPEPKTIGQEAVKLGAGLFGGAGGELNALKKGASLPSSAEELSALSGKMHALASSLYEKAKNAGVNFHPTWGKTLSDDLGKLFKGAEARGNPNTLAEISGITKDFDSGNLSLKNLIEARKNLNAAARTEPYAANRAKAVIDTALKNSKKSVISGDSAAIDTANQANSVARKAFIHEDFTKMLSAAGDSGGKLRKALIKTRDSEDFKLLPETVQKLVRQGAKGNTAGKILDAVGSIKKILGIKVLAPLAAVGELGSYASQPQGGIPVAPIAAGAAAYGVGAGANALGATMQRAPIYDILKTLEKIK